MPRDVWSSTDEFPNWRLPIKPHLHQSRSRVPRGTDWVPRVQLVVLPCKFYPLISDMGLHLLICAIPENQKVICIGGCSQREKGVASIEVCEWPAGNTKTVIFMLLLTFSNTVRTCLHFELSVVPVTDG